MSLFRYRTENQKGKKKPSTWLGFRNNGFEAYGLFELIDDAWITTHHFKLVR